MISRTVLGTENVEEMKTVPKMLEQEVVFQDGMNHILLVEDNDVNRAMMVTLLKGLNLTCVEAVNGIEAMQAVMTGEREFNCILMGKFLFCFFFFFFFF
jgi:hypothetical protein